MNLSARLKNALRAMPASAAYAAPIETMAPGATVYAIGDVHGCVKLLRDIEARIVADAAGRTGSLVMVLLGDCIDRGPHSAAVLDHLVFDAPPDGFHRICLAGNHEAMMRDFLTQPNRNHEWLSFGGRETLLSYGFDLQSLSRLSARKLSIALHAHIPDEHYRFLEGLPLIAESDSHIFVHAGLRKDVPLTAQTERDLLWGSEIGPDPDGTSRIIVHGHTARAEPTVTGSAICVDTGAYQSNRLTAVRLCGTAGPVFLTAGLSKEI